MIAPHEIARMRRLCRDAENARERARQEKLAEEREFLQSLDWTPEQLAAYDARVRSVAA